MTKKTEHSFLLWCIPCVILFLCFCSCTSQKPETGKTAEQTGSGITPKPLESSGPAESGSLSPPAEKEEANAPETLSKDGPKVDKARFQIETVNGTDRLKVMAEGSDKNGNKVSLRFQWTKNGEPAGEGDTISGFKRGDKISVMVTPFDDRGDGLPRNLTTEIKNTPPVIVEHQETNFDGKVWSYQVKATDADGDPLTYSLKSAPQGMTIGATTGFITWEVPPQFVGKAPVTVSVSDGHGGEATYNFDVTIKTAPQK
ncbi:MAG TPA: hypothetical protein DCP92_11595 [Nitrospiraceae bacterium]|nr:hypothetical protein [Nitrospiraceae bacterium]